MRWIGLSISFIGIMSLWLIAAKFDKDRAIAYNAQRVEFRAKTQNSRNELCVTFYKWSETMKIDVPEMHKMCSGTE